MRQNALASLRHYRERHRRSGQGAVDHRARACRCRRASAPELDAGARCERRRRSRSRRAIPASPTGNFSRSCCASSTRRIARVAGQDIGGPGAAYANADELILDLRVIETRARARRNSPSLARQSGQAGAPRGRDFPLLDRQARSPREHDRTTAALQALWWATAGHGERRPPELGSREWRSWLLRELARPLTGPRLIPQLSGRGRRADRHVPPGGRDSGARSTATPSARSSCR